MNGSVYVQYFVMSLFFLACSKNPFEVHPCYTHWAPWIGKETRKSDGLLNTEFKKMLASETEGEVSSVTADRLCEELLKQNVGFVLWGSACTFMFFNICYNNRFAKKTH